MHTEAVFEDIANRIQKEISKANNSIIIAVAWFTNRNLFETVLQKAKQGCKVYLMITDDEINNNSQINYEILNSHNSFFYKISNSEKILMHNKFCVIDSSVVITGSYNWSYKAEMNHENIVIHYNDINLANQFTSEFNYLLSIYFPETTSPISNLNSSILEIIKRLEVLQNYITLEDLDDIQYATGKLKKFDTHDRIKSIVFLTENQLFGKAMETIQNFLTEYRQLSIWNDPEINGLQLELKILENQINAFENEKTYLEKTITDFQHLHTKEIGRTNFSDSKNSKA